MSNTVEYFYSGVIKKNTCANIHAEVGFFHGSFSVGADFTLKAVMDDLMVHLSREHKCSLSEVHVQQFNIIKLVPEVK